MAPLPPAGPGLSTNSSNSFAVSRSCPDSGYQMVVQHRPHGRQEVTHAHCPHAHCPLARASHGLATGERPALPWRMRRADQSIIDPRSSAAASRGRTGSPPHGSPGESVLHLPVRRAARAPAQRRRRSTRQHRARRHTRPPASTSAVRWTRHGSRPTGVGGSLSTSRPEAPRRKVCLATSDDPAALQSGRYLRRREPLRANPAGYDRDLQEALVEVCAPEWRARAGLTGTALAGTDCASPSSQGRRRRAMPAVRQPDLAPPRRGECFASDFVSNARVGNTQPNWSCGEEDQRR
jgi:hypothetical protein